MRVKDIAIGLSVCAMIALASVPSTARDLRPRGAGWGDCVRTVRSLSDFDVRGDAWMWWQNASGRYARDNSPAVGSVLVFKRTAHLGRGHVSLVSGVIDNRTIKVDHTWIAGRGIRYGMKVVDVSPENDWSQVRVWHAPTEQLGQRVYPIYGFILPQGAKQNSDVISVADNTDSQTTYVQDDDIPVTVAPAGRQRVRSARQTVTIGRSSFRTSASAMMVPPRKPDQAAHSHAAAAKPGKAPTSRSHQAAAQKNQGSKAQAVKNHAAPAAAEHKTRFSPIRKPIPASAAAAPAHKPAQTKKRVG